MHSRNVAMLPTVLLLFSTSAACTEEPPVVASEPTSVKPKRVELLSLQVSKLPRDEFGKGIKLGTNRKAAFWLVNSGTALYGRFELDENLVRIDRERSRLVRFVDDTGRDLTASPTGKEINTFFEDNQPISVELGAGGEGEFVLRAHQVPAPGASELTVEANLFCLAASGKRTVERKNVSTAAGTEVEVGPVRFKVVEPDLLSREFGERLAERSGRAPDAALVFEPPEKAVDTVELVDAAGKVIRTFRGESIAKATPRTLMLFKRPDAAHVNVRATYFEHSKELQIPVRISARLGF